MLPKINGYEICRAVRAQGIDVPILMLTAKGLERDVILGLNLGADDYITKPFRVGELIARARAFLRRRGPAPDVVRFGDCEVDLGARKVTRDGIALDLTAKEFALLAYFCTRPGCALSRDVILNAVWAMPCSSRSAASTAASRPFGRKSNPARTSRCTFRPSATLDTASSRAATLRNKRPHRSAI